MKILHIITRLDKGGSSTNTLLSAIGLAEKGNSVSLLYGDTKNHDEDLLKRALLSGVAIFPESSLVRDIHPVSDLKAFFRIKKFIKGAGYDVVHAHSSKAGLIGRMAARLSGVKAVVYTPHGHVFYAYFSKGLTLLIKLMERLGALFSDRIIGLTQAECEEWISQRVGRREQYLHIPSGIEFDKLEVKEDNTALRKSLNVPQSAKLIGSMGRFVGVKGFEYFIDAAVMQIKKRDDVVFALAGDGKMKELYREKLDKANVLDRFHILPWQETSAEFLNDLDIFVLSSLNEGMGRVLIEAMYLGKPVVATKVGGVPSVLANECGLLVEPGDAGAISGAIDLLMSDPALASEMVQKARYRVLSDYSAQIMVDKLEELYKEILASKSKV